MSINTDRKEGFYHELGVDMLIAAGPHCRDYMVPAAREAGCTDVRWYGG